LFYGLYNQHKPLNIIYYATAAAFGKLQEFGDATGQNELTVSKAVESAL
jgi:2-dehydro-3-deoxygluconokinase